MRQLIDFARTTARKQTADARLPYPTVSLTAWRPKDGSVNFGDQMSKVIVTLMLASRGMTFEDEAKAPREMAAIGSILHFVRDGAAIWGSGVNGKIAEDQYQFRNLDVRAVRGPLTRKFLMARGIAVPEVYGDPALLIGLLAGTRFRGMARNIEIGFVPNLNDLKAAEPVFLPPGVQMISPLRAWHHCVTDIARCKLVIASSLHGIIVAEALGIPARLVRLSPHEHMFKYQDYYEGTGRAGIQPVTSVTDAIDKGGEPLPAFRPGPLIDAFPWDLWTGAHRPDREAAHV